MASVTLFAVPGFPATPVSFDCTDKAAKRLAMCPLPGRPPLPLECGEESLVHEARARDQLVDRQLRRLLNPRAELSLG